MPAQAPMLDDATFRRLCRAKDLARDQFNAALHTALLAQTAALSRWHFHRLFTAAFGVTPHHFLTELRITHAKRLLAEGGHSVTEACFATGYECVGSFSAKFRAQVGRSPAEYRREVRRVFGPAAASRYLYIPCCFLYQLGCE